MPCSAPARHPRPLDPGIHRPVDAGAAGRERGEPTFEEASFGTGRREPDGVAVAFRGLVAPTRAAQQVGVRGGEQVVVVESPRRRESGDRVERAVEVPGEADGDRAVQFDHRRRGARAKPVVPGDDGRPVGVGRVARASVQRLDLGLHAVGPRRRRGARASRAWASRACARALEQGESLGHLGVVPPGAVLLVERHELAVGVDARRRPRVLQQQQREQRPGLVLIGQQGGHEPREPDRLVLQVEAQQPVARRSEVPLVVHEHEHGEHAAESLGKLARRRHPVGNAGVADLALGAHEPLRHRRLGHEEGTRDLTGLEPADGAQRERHPRLERQRGMRAREDQPQPVVPLGRGRGELGRVGRRTAPRQLIHHHPLLHLAELDAPAAQHVERAVARDGGQPRTGVAGHPLALPSRRGLLERVGGRLLGEIPVAGHADERRDDARPLLAIDAGDGLGCLVAHAVPVVHSSMGQNGRSSMRPPRAIGCRDATSIA